LVAIATDPVTGVQFPLWRFMPKSVYSFSGVAVANGVVYFVSVFDPHVYALDAPSGQVLAALPVGGMYYGYGGPAIAHGRVFVGTASTGGVAPNYTAGGSIVALGIPGEETAIERAGAAGRIVVRNSPTRFETPVPRHSRVIW
jgi:outer membrane protein assembly factor BamB